jgi:hypothetical protein
MARLYLDEYNLAKKILKSLRGHLEWSTHEAEAFRFKTGDVLLVFYPHRSTNGHYHIRVRDAASRNSEYADFIMRKLCQESGNNSTFTRRESHEAY